MVIRESHSMRWAAISLGVETPGEMPSMIGILCPANPAAEDGFRSHHGLHRTVVAASGKWSPIGVEFTFSNTHSLSL